MKTSFTFILCLLFLVSFGQKNDYIWEIGTVGVPPPIPIEDTATFQRTRLDFNYDPVRITFDWTNREMDFRASNSIYANDKGIFQCMSNRTWIADKTQKPMMGGDSLFMDALWPIFYPIGQRTPQSTLMLPWPSNDKRLMLLTHKVDDDFTKGLGIWYSLIDLSLNMGLGEVVEREKLIHTNLEYDFGYLTALRHANGRDWWILSPSLKFEEIHIFLFDPNGIKYVNSQQVNKSKTEDAHGQCQFSPDGSKYAVVTTEIGIVQAYVYLFDFDRCTGTLSNEANDTMSYNLNDLGLGMTFSPNSEYLYVNNNDSIFQYEVNTSGLDDKEFIAEFDGTLWVNPAISVPYDFGHWAIGPDGKLYLVPANSSNRLHVMNYPNEAADQVDFVQRAAVIKNCYQSVPNVPNYRLGPDDGSACDTLGINNNPVAKFRYEADSMDHLNIRFTDLSYFKPETWSWDYGNGQSEDIQNPYHRFSAAGVYEVCLTVSNENGPNTSCRILTLGDPDATSAPTVPVDVSIYPNPVVDDLLVTMSDYVPADGRIEIYDMMGQKVAQHYIGYGWNSVSVQAIPSGTYIYKVFDGVHLIAEGKLIKI